jgi:hypothetical protein
VHFSGKVTGTEYQQFLAALHERLHVTGAANLVVELEDFEFYGDLESAGQDMKFGFGEYTHIQRAAFVGDQTWLDWFVRFIGPLTPAKEKHFPAGQFADAFAWASVGA